MNRVEYHQHICDNEHLLNIIHQLYHIGDPIGKIYIYIYIYILRRGEGREQISEHQHEGDDIGMINCKYSRMMIDLKYRNKPLSTVPRRPYYIYTINNIYIYIYIYKYDLIFAINNN